MAKYLGTKQWGTIFASVLNRGKTLRDEAQRLGMKPEELLQMGDKKFTHSTEWENCKRLSEKREKKQVLQKRNSAIKAPAPAPTNASTPTPTPEPAPAPAAPADPMEELLRRKEELQREVAEFASSLEKAREILQIRQESLSDAQSVLEKAQAAVQKAEAEEADAKAVVQETQEQRGKIQQELQVVEQEIQRLKEKTVYLIDPWFTGELPEDGTFFSTVEMEGVTLREVPEEYLPEASLEGVLLFDFVPDYKKARVFCGLVTQFELEETPYSLLVSDERVKELLKMYIGK